jgi:hypothetical protein
MLRPGLLMISVISMLDSMPPECVNEMAGSLQFESMRHATPPGKTPSRHTMSLPLHDVTLVG